MCLIRKHPTFATEDTSEHSGFSNHWLAFHFPSNPWHHHQLQTNIFILRQASVIYFCKLPFTPTEIKKRKQGLERVGEVKSCRSIIYQLPNLQHVPQTRHGTMHFAHLRSLWRLFICHFLRSFSLSKSNLTFSFSLPLAPLGHNSLNLDPNAHIFEILEIRFKKWSKIRLFVFAGFVCGWLNRFKIKSVSPSWRL